MLCDYIQLELTTGFTSVLIIAHNVCMWGEFYHSRVVSQSCLFLTLSLNKLFLHIIVLVEEQ